MSQSYLPARTRLIPPRLRPQFLARPRIGARLGQILAYPLTIVKADAGYGKTTALAAFLAAADAAHLWYSLTESDADPLIFCSSLLYAFRGICPTCGSRSIALLESTGAATRLWTPIVDALADDLLEALPGETILVLDDYHLVDSVEVNAITERLVEQMPPRLHLVLSTRATPNLPLRIHWRVHGELLEITQPDLAFTPAEVAALFAQQYNYRLTENQAGALAAETEGWGIALQMIAQRLQARPGQSFDEVLGQLPGSLELLFDYLASEILAKQPANIQDFLLKTAALRRLDAAIAAHLLGWSDQQTAKTLRYLDQHSLFIIALHAGAFRYHHLFQDFLARRAEAAGPDGWRELHRRAATVYRGRGEDEEAVYHLLQAGESPAAAVLLREIGGTMIAAGRWETLADWLDRLPGPQLQRYPDLLFWRGEAHRLSSQFAAALACYQEARRHAQDLRAPALEIQALQGQVMVYLDTVQPAPARPLLAEARRLARADPAARARLLALTAENLTNEGRLPQAQHLATALARCCPAPGRATPDPRLYTRMGRLAEARTLVEQNLRADSPVPQPPRAPRSHRESTVLLAWICALLGDAEAARAYADQGLRLARALRAPIVEVAALARLGHAYLTGPDADLARAGEFYQQSLRLGETIGVPRFRAEALLGQVIAGGMQGRPAAAADSARTALGIVEAAGDRYFTAILWLALGGAAVIGNDERAGAWLATARGLSARCADAYGVCVADTWRALWHLQRRDWPAFDEAARAALQNAQQHDYGFVFLRPTFFGPKKMQQTAELLLAANRRAICAGYTAALLQEVAAQLPMLLPDTPAWSPFQPAGSAPDAGTLHVQTLGLFRVWRGEHEIPRTAWSRDKAVQLFQILLARRGRPLHREQLVDLLWPDGKAAASALRVTLNALRQTLEPDRAPEAESRFIQRQGESLLLNPDADIRVDADEFERLIGEAQAAEARHPAQAPALYRRALALYRGDFLPGALYEEWAGERRDRLADLYLTTASHLADLLAAQGGHSEAVALCHQILARDPCWEEAYYLLMVCYAQQGNRSLALRTYARCAKHLRAELGVEPAARTQALFKALSNDP
jgi:ATP/maltotriose-dependent transcriptional regulator MalT/DNA-binding SARP family transcriptional activator